MKPIDYFLQLSLPEKKAYAKRAGSTFGNVQKHYLAKSGPRRMPRPSQVINLAKASEGNVSLDEAIDYFLVQPVKQLAEASTGSQGLISEKNSSSPSSTLRSSGACPPQAVLF